MNNDYYKNSNFYNLIHSGNKYWLASRYVFTDIANAVNFGVRYVNENNLSGSDLFYSVKLTANYGCCLRPVVSLKSNIKLVGGNGEEGTPYQIAGQQ